VTAALISPVPAAALGLMPPSKASAAIRMIWIAFLDFVMTKIPQAL
jgi:hypothetical protein